MALDDYEIKQTGNISDELGIFVGERVFAVPHDLVATLRPDWMPSLSNVWPYADTDGTYYKPCIERYTFQRECPGYDGHAMVTCWYRRPTVDRILTQLPLPFHGGNAIIKYGRGVLETGIVGEAKQALVKQKVAEMRDTTSGKTYMTRWDITSGRHYILDPQTQLTIRAVTQGLTNANLNTFSSLWVGYTATGLSPITGVTAANLMLAGYRLARHPANAALQHVEFVFLYDADGWKIDYSQKYTETEIPYPPDAEVGFTDIVNTITNNQTVAKGIAVMSELADLLDETQWATTWA